MEVEQIVKGLADAIPQGPHPDPHAEWIRVRLDFVQQAIDTLDWLDKGVAEWRDSALSNGRQAAAARAQARIAIKHLQAALVPPSSPLYAKGFEDAREWLVSIGGDPL
jgi:hypothetical protein